ncbi:hypothetical protein B0T20DRAFT_418007 [Sordaria brevicollis]|uniref:Uncharacterized protein n=1 Tax=Sordaria brevicollis TaxID=83679 RepID=A0AAE0PAR8_SORBR|nr:hypothetical protein B0T20DRAFT_418007 [Sordaria brevicollis]
MCPAVCNCHCHCHWEGPRQLFPRQRERGTYRLHYLGTLISGICTLHGWSLERREKRTMFGFTVLWNLKERRETGSVRRAGLALNGYLCCNQFPICPILRTILIPGVHQGVPRTKQGCIEVAWPRRQDRTLKTRKDNTSSPFRHHSIGIKHALRWHTLGSFTGPSSSQKVVSTQDYQRALSHRPATPPADIQFSIK